MSPPADQVTDGLQRTCDATGRRIVVKRRSGAPAGFFAAEQRGLNALADTRTLRVPEVIECSATHIVIEDLGNGHPTDADWMRAGEQLAALHATRAAQFGWDIPGWCGDSAQDNTPGEDGHRFFVERRLLPQARRAHEAGLLPTAEVTRLERMCLRIDRLLPEAPAVLVHGDLWSGNLHACESGELALIDGGAVHHGWAETDLAMLTLFGEPQSASSALTSPRPASMTAGAHVRRC